MLRGSSCLLYGPLPTRCHRRCKIDGLQEYCGCPGQLSSLNKQVSTLAPPLPLETQDWRPCPLFACAVQYGHPGRHLLWQIRAIGLWSTPTTSLRSIARYIYFQYAGRTPTPPVYPTSGHVGHSGYITHTVSGFPDASKRGTKSEVAHKWAGWLHKPLCLRGPRCFRAGDKIRKGPQAGRVTT